ncbi:MAG: Rrf2 family transcriptional regulator [Hyphomonadaceae bacterium]
MQITTFSDYCLRILIFLAVDDAAKTSSKEIAQRYGISIEHAAKASKWLTRAGYVESVRGKGGGISLVRAPDTIKLGQLIRLTEGRKGLVQCQRDHNNECIIHGACALPSILNTALSAFYETLDGFTLADVIKNQEGLAALLQNSDVPHET